MVDNKIHISWKIEGGGDVSLQFKASKTEMIVLNSLILTDFI